MSTCSFINEWFSHITYKMMKVFTILNQTLVIYVIILLILWLRWIFSSYLLLIRMEFHDFVWTQTYFYSCEVKHKILLRNNNCSKKLRSTFCWMAYLCTYHTTVKRSECFIKPGLKFLNEFCALHFILSVKRNVHLKLKWIYSLWWFVFSENILWISNQVLIIPLKLFLIQNLSPHLKTTKINGTYNSIKLYLKKVNVEYSKYLKYQ